MSETVHALIGYNRHYPNPDNVIRVFENERDAEKWAILLEVAKNDAHFPVTYAELKQDFEWVPEYSKKNYEVVSYDVHANGWDE